MRNLNSRMRGIARNVMPLMALTDEEKRGIARAIWSYTGTTQGAFEQAVGLRKGRFKEITRDAKKSAPTLDELVKMAEHAGIPTTIAVDGWAAADPLARLEDQVNDLAAAHRELTATVAQQGREIRALRGRGHPEEPTGD